MGSLQSLPEAHFHILMVLADGDKHGYSIMQEVAALTGGKTKLSPGTLYGAIQRLAEEGLIDEVRSTAKDERRRTYRITAAGRRAATLEVQRLGILLDRARTNGLASKPAKV